MLVFFVQLISAICTYTCEIPKLVLSTPGVVKRVIRLIYVSVSCIKTATNHALSRKVKGKSEDMCICACVCNKIYVA